MNRLQIQLKYPKTYHQLNHSYSMQRNFQAGEANTRFVSWTCNQHVWQNAGLHPCHTKIGSERIKKCVKRIYTHNLKIFQQNVKIEITENCKKLKNIWKMLKSAKNCRKMCTLSKFGNFSWKAALRTKDFTKVTDYTWTKKALNILVLLLTMNWKICLDESVYF